MIIILLLLIIRLGIVIRYSLILDHELIILLILVDDDTLVNMLLVFYSIARSLVNIITKSSITLL